MTDQRTDGLHRGLSTMSEGEVAQLRCAPGKAWSRDGVSLPAGEDIVYETELLQARDGPAPAEPGVDEVCT